MASANIAILMGNIVRAPELSTTKSEKTLVKFSIATNEKTGGGERTDFHEVIAWGKIAETVARWKKAGDMVHIVGRIRQDRWTDPDGRKRTKVVIEADKVGFLSTRSHHQTEPADAGIPEAEDLAEPIAA
jgi:single-strand DNA-binding protein